MGQQSFKVSASHHAIVHWCHIWWDFQPIQNLLRSALHKLFLLLLPLSRLQCSNSSWECSVTRAPTDIADIAVRDSADRMTVWWQLVLSPQLPPLHSLPNMREEDIGSGDICYKATYQRGPYLTWQNGVKQTKSTVALLALCFVFNLAGYVLLFRAMTLIQLFVVWPIQVFCIH